MSDLEKSTVRSWEEYCQVRRRVLSGHGRSTVRSGEVSSWGSNVTSGKRVLSGHGGSNVTSGKEYCQVMGVESCHVGKRVLSGHGE